MKKTTDSLRITRLREALRQTQRELAKELGVSHAVVALWESSKRPVAGPVKKLITIYEQQLGLESWSDENVSDDLIAELKLSKFARGQSAVKLGIKMTTNLFLNGFSNLFKSGDTKNPIRRSAYLALGNQMVETLSQLKGTGQKLGQILSYMDPEMPDDVREYFRHLQDDAERMSTRQLNDVFLAEFGKLPTQIFKKWDAQAFAAGSLGQVHEAVLQTGERVAVKVQYPDLEKVLNEDLSLFGVFEKMAPRFFKSYKAGSVHSELRERLLEEINFTHEGTNLDRFAKIFKKHPQIRIPHFFAEVSSSKILVTEFLEGQTYREFLAKASSQQKNHSAKVIWDFVWESIFKHRVFSADPHPGNYIFLKNGQVGFVDFGCVKRIPNSYFESWIRFLKSIRDRDKKQMMIDLQALGVFDDPTQIDVGHFMELMVRWYKPCFQNSEYQFDRQELGVLWQTMTTKNPNLDKIHFPKDLVYLNQIQWGLCSLMADMGACGKWALDLDQL